MTRLQHIPVLLQETLEYLDLKEGKTIVDCTLGLGGHSKEILKRIGENGRLIAIEQDEENLKVAQENLKEFSKQVLYISDNFGNLKEIFEKNKLGKVDGIFFDLGISSVHLDVAEKGFSIKQAGPLDMRMDKRNKLTAAEIVNTYSEEELVKIFWRYGEEKQSRKVARAIIAHRESKKIEQTNELADVIAEVKSKMRWGGGHPAAQVFQALRIEVNQELDVLKKGLEDALELLNKGGRMVVLSYHSLEDRIVKKFFKENTRECICPVSQPVCTCDWERKVKLISKLIIPTEDEIKINPRSRSAKMRVIEKLI